MGIACALRGEPIGHIFGSPTQRASNADVFSFHDVIMDNDNDNNDDDSGDDGYTCSTIFVAWTRF